MWQNERVLASKAKHLKFDYPAIVGPTVVSLAANGENERARKIAALVKGTAFAQSMEIAIASATPFPNEEQIQLLVEEVGEELGAGYPLSGLLAFRVVGEAGVWKRLQGEIYSPEDYPENWIEDLSLAGLREETFAALTAWKKRPGTLGEEWYPVHLHARLVLSDFDDLSGDGTIEEEQWYAKLETEKKCL